ncbi:Arm DNA-binding domain-containing protein [Enterobacter bugandensis]|uniref:Arm DNA-binding domain-containing protein n=1 Tax=Enterobacter TaxID=547 RepID=UPI00292CC0BC
MAVNVSFTQRGMMIYYPSHYLMGTHEKPDSFINSLLIIKKKEMLFALLLYCFSALQLSVYCRMRCYGGREQVKRQGVKSLHGKPLPRQKMLADGRELSARVSMSGAVSFVYFFRHSGRQSAPVWMTLGKYPDMTLKQAREKRDECRAWFSPGLDPRKENKLTKEKLFTPVTV